MNAPTLRALFSPRGSPERSILLNTVTGFRFAGRRSNDFLVGRGDSGTRVDHKKQRIGASDLFPGTGDADRSTLSAVSRRPAVSMIFTGTPSI